MVRTILVDEDICLEIEALQYEVESRKEIIAQVLAGMINIAGDLFEKYQTEYREYFVKYNHAKLHMLKTYGVNVKSTWSLDFITHELTVED